MYDKKTLEKKRSLVKELFFKKHLNKSTITRQLSVSYPFVRRWTRSKDDSIKDKRGWPKGKRRSRSKPEVERVIKIRQNLISHSAFFFGPDKILDEYQRLYPHARPINRSFVTRVISEAFPESRRDMLKAVKNQHYPLKTLSNLGRIQEGIDFIGQRYIYGSSQPIHFFTRVYKKPFTLRLIKRVVSQRMRVALEVTAQDWKQYPIPDTLWLDNGFSFTASGQDPRIVSPFIQYLLLLGITPLFIAPKKPWMNGAVEGTNSVFAKKVWKRYTFTSLSEIDQVLERFEKEYQSYSPLPKRLPGKLLDEDFHYQDLLNKEFEPKPKMAIYFIRLVEPNEEEQPAIRILKEQIFLSPEYLNTYVLGKLDVAKQNLTLYIQPNDSDLKPIAEQRFPLRFAKLKVKHSFET